MMKCKQTSTASLKNISMTLPRLVKTPQPALLVSDSADPAVVEDEAPGKTELRQSRYDYAANGATPEHTVNSDKESQEVLISGNVTSSGT